VVNRLAYGWIRGDLGRSQNGAQAIITTHKSSNGLAMPSIGAAGEIALFLIAVHGTRHPLPSPPRKGEGAGRVHLCVRPAGFFWPPGMFLGLSSNLTLVPRPPRGKEAPNLTHVLLPPLGGEGWGGGCF
jgi:hypothetical protein